LEKVNTDIHHNLQRQIEDEQAKFRSLFSDFKKIQDRKVDLVRYASKIDVIKEFSEEWEPQPKLDEIYLRTILKKDPKDAIIEQL
jgi:hypothetical protein